MWRGVLAADPLAVPVACYSEAHVFISDMPTGLSAVWVRCVEFGRVSPQSPSAVFWLRTAPHCHVEPEPVFTCHFCWRPCVSWGPHLWYECPCVVWGASYAFASALTVLQCDGRVWHSPYHCTVYKGDRAVVWALAHESAFPGVVQYTPCPAVYVTWSGLVHFLRPPPGRPSSGEGSYHGVIPWGARRLVGVTMAPSARVAAQHDPPGSGLASSVGGGGTGGVAGALSRAPSGCGVRCGLGATGRGGCPLPVSMSGLAGLPPPPPYI